MAGKFKAAKRAVGAAAAFIPVAQGHPQRERPCRQGPAHRSRWNSPMGDVSHPYGSADPHSRGHSTVCPAVTRSPGQPVDCQGRRDRSARPGARSSERRPAQEDLGPAQEKRRSGPGRGGAPHQSHGRLRIQAGPDAIPRRLLPTTRRPTRFMATPRKHRAGKARGIESVRQTPAGPSPSGGQPAAGHSGPGGVLAPSEATHGVCGDDDSCHVLTRRHLVHDLHEGLLEDGT